MYFTFVSKLEWELPKRNLPNYLKTIIPTLIAKDWLTIIIINNHNSENQTPNPTEFIVIANTNWAQGSLIIRIICLSTHMQLGLTFIHTMF